MQTKKAQSVQFSKQVNKRITDSQNGQQQFPDEDLELQKKIKIRGKMQAIPPPVNECDHFLTTHRDKWDRRTYTHKI